MMNRRSVTLRSMLVAGMTALTLMVATLPSVSYAFDQNASSALNLDKDRVILHGYDAVAYHTEGKAVKGAANVSAAYDGATYHFASAANRDAFKANPAKYAPAYGGFCAMGAALEKKLDGDPELFKIVDGQLYLNVNADVAKVWTRDIPGNIAKANANWPEIKNKTPVSLQ